MTAVASQGGNRGFFVANPTANRKAGPHEPTECSRGMRLELAQEVFNARGTQGSGRGIFNPHLPFSAAQKGGRFPTFPPLGFF